REGACRHDRLAVGGDRLALHVIAPARAEGAEVVDGLRRQPDMPHDRDAALDEVTDGSRHVTAALELHRTAARLLHDARSGAEGGLRPLLVGAEGKID